MIVEEDVEVPTMLEDAVEDLVQAVLSQPEQLRDENAVAGGGKLHAKIGFTALILLARVYLATRGIGPSSRPQRSIYKEEICGNVSRETSGLARKRMSLT